jgi:hypothetical protein
MPAMSMSNHTHRHIKHLHTLMSQSSIKDHSPNCAIPHMSGNTLAHQGREGITDLHAKAWDLGR